jgi:acyl-CoA thioester hydrolase
MTRPSPHIRADYVWYTDITTRWADNDIYGHVNSKTYYSYFDTIVNRYLIEMGGLDIHQGNLICLVVDSSCSYFSPVAFPDRLDGGLRVAHLGYSSVYYEIGVFKEGDEATMAQGQLVHVFVDRETRKPVAIPTNLRNQLALLMPVGA